MHALSLSNSKFFLLRSRAAPPAGTRSSRRHRLYGFNVLLACAIGACAAGPLAAQVPEPDDFFGFEVGQDGNYTSWETELAYFEKVAAESDRVELTVLGESTLGNPFVLLTISAPENLANAERYKEISRLMADPRGLTKEQIGRMAQEGKTIVLMTLGQHSTEVASSQMAPLLVHQLATGTDDQTRAILEDAIVLLIPSFNPDGFVMVKDWTDKTRGTPYQGSYLPYLYQHYAGHDNNRDAFMLNLVESKLWASVAYDWFPQIYQDTHQMGSYGSRIFVPSKTDPILPDVEPIVWREMMLLGAAMATELEAAGVKGVETKAGGYTGWQMPTFHGMTPSRNIVGFHTESASSQMIWPLEIAPAELTPADRGRPGHFPQESFPNPWLGGTWRMSDIVFQQKIALLASLEAAARNHKMFLGNMAVMAGNQVEKGKNQAPYAHVIPLSQHDPATAAKMIALLMEAKVEVYRAAAPFQSGSVTVAAGDYVIPSSQPLRGYVHSLLVPYIYPDNALTRNPDGTPLAPKDFASANLGELMGVDVVALPQPLTGSLERLTAAPSVQGQVTGSGSAGWLLAPELNDSFRAVNRVLAAGGDIYRLAAPAAPMRPGTFWIPAAGTIDSAMVTQMAADFGLTFTALPAAPGSAAHGLEPARVGIFRRHGGGLEDEGWTRLIFDDWKFPYSSVEPAEVLEGNLNGRFDTIVLPDDSVEAMLRVPQSRGGIPYPPEYSVALGEEGVEQLKAFARAGGTLVFIDRASQLAIEKFGIPVRNAVGDLSSKEFYSPGSMLRVDFDPSNPLAYGMPDEGLVMFDDSPAFEVTSPRGISIAATYPEGNLLQSGWLDGESHIAGKSALLSVTYGKGRLVLIGFGPQTRAETHGSYKVLFNSLYLDE